VCVAALCVAVPTAEDRVLVHTHNTHPHQPHNSREKIWLWKGKNYRFCTDDCRLFHLVHYLSFIVWLACSLFAMWEVPLVPWVWDI
jgi:hypothetical protein